MYPTACKHHSVRVCEQIPAVRLMSTFSILSPLYTRENKHERTNMKDCAKHTKQKDEPKLQRRYEGKSVSLSI